VGISKKAALPMAPMGAFSNLTTREIEPLPCATLFNEIARANDRRRTSQASQSSPLRTDL
jgi:hypothetical protein